VWKVSRLGVTTESRLPENKGPQTIAILQTLNSRLEGIRKRHDEIDPLEDLPDDDLFDTGRCSVDSTRGVANQPWIIDELTEESLLGDNDDKFDAEKSLPTLASSEAFNTPDEGLNAYFDELPIRKQVQREGLTKMVNWLKVLRPGKKAVREKFSDPRIQPFNVHEELTTGHLFQQKSPQAGSEQRETDEASRTISIDASRLQLEGNEDNDQTVTELTETEEREHEEPFSHMPNSPNAEGPTFFQFEVGFY